MTVWEKLFGTPERTADIIDGCDTIDMCDWMADITGINYCPDKCKQCIYDFDRYGCERKDMSLLEWLTQEVDG